MDFIVLYHFLKNPFSKSYHFSSCFFLFLIFLVFPNYWFSDDSIRHIYDAYYFLHRIDPYQISPKEAGFIFGMERLPNHPDHTTIYFPFTQLVALISIYLANLLFIYTGISLWELFFRLGFFMIEIFIIYQIIKKDYQYLSFFLTPIFLLESSSCHTDIHGVLILFMILVLKSFYLTSFFLPFLLFIKPEGWIIFFNFFFAILFRLIKLKQYKKVYKFLFLNFSSIFLFLFLIFIFYLNGFITRNTFDGFIKQMRIYNNNFLAYQPFILLIQNFFHWESWISIHYYRENISIILFLLAIILFTIWILKQKKRRFTKRFFYIVVLFQLVLFFLYRASWQPWYFLWFFPFLFCLKKFEIINAFSAILLLWYIPVVFLHLEGHYQYSIFFLHISVWCILWLFKIYNTKK